MRPMRMVILLTCFHHISNTFKREVVHGREEYTVVFNDIDERTAEEAVVELDRIGALTNCITYNPLVQSLKIVVMPTKSINATMHGW